SCYPQPNLPIIGYEIHQGLTQLIGNSSVTPGSEFLPLFADKTLGIVNQNQSLWGCYLHGIFDNGPWRRHWLNRLRKQRGLSELSINVGNYQEQREELFDRGADVLREFLDLSGLITYLNN
ncbi:MAG: cobyric acid synthase CobQ, partial [Microcystaceae cyanobacterium]